MHIHFHLLTLGLTLAVTGCSTATKTRNSFFSAGNTNEALSAIEPLPPDKATASDLARLASDPCGIEGDYGGFTSKNIMYISGSFWVANSASWQKSPDGARKVVVKIPTHGRFKGPYTFGVALAGIDSSKDANLRIRVERCYSLPGHFGIAVATWADTHIFFAKVAWWAHGTPAD